MLEDLEQWRGMIASGGPEAGWSNEAMRQALEDIDGLRQRVAALEALMVAVDKYMRLVGLEPGPTAEEVRAARAAIGAGKVGT